MLASSAKVVTITPRSISLATFIAPNKLEKLFFDVIKQTAQFEGKSLDEDSTLADIQALDTTERDKALRNMFGGHSIKG